jgi:hypothetical protein
MMRCGAPAGVATVDGATPLLFAPHAAAQLVMMAATISEERRATEFLDEPEQQEASKL